MKLEVGMGENCVYKVQMQTVYQKPKTATGLTSIRSRFEANRKGNSTLAQCAPVQNRALFFSSFQLNTRMPNDNEHRTDSFSTNWIIACNDIKLEQLSAMPELLLIHWSIAPFLGRFHVEQLPNSKSVELMISSCIRVVVVCELQMQQKTKQQISNNTLYTARENLLDCE